MEKDYSLQCLDYAIGVTRQKPRTEKHNFNSATYLTGAIMQYLEKNNAQGFTSANDARAYIVGDNKRGIPGITKENIEEQLLKHVIKSISAKERNGFAQSLGTGKDFSTARTTDDAQQVIYKSMKTMHMEGISYALEQYPDMYKLLAAGFVEERYFDYHMGPQELDQPMNRYENDYYYQKIDEYYNSARTNSR